MSTLLAVVLGLHILPIQPLPPHRPTGALDCPTRVRVHFTHVAPIQPESDLEGEYPTVEDASLRAEEILRAGYWRRPDRVTRSVQLVPGQQVRGITIHPLCDEWWESLPRSITPR